MDQGPNPEVPVSEAWNGSTWSEALPPPPPPTGESSLEGVSCFSATSCTAVGSVEAFPMGPTFTLGLYGERYVVDPHHQPGWCLGHRHRSGPLRCGLPERVGLCGRRRLPSIPSTIPPRSPSPSVPPSRARATGSWQATAGVFSFPTGANSPAPFLGSLGNLTLNVPIVGMAVMPAGDGYYEVASDGGVFAFGSAQFYGSMGGTKLNKPVVGMAVTFDGGGYWLVASDGGIFSFGDAEFFGSTGSLTLNKPVVGMAPVPNGLGYYLVASDGGIFAYPSSGPGAAPFEGSTGSLTLNKPIVGMAVTPAGGYYLVASDGGIFGYPNSGANAATFLGSTGSIKLNKPIVGMAVTPGGYYLVRPTGASSVFPAAAHLPSTDRRATSASISRSWAWRANQRISPTWRSRSAFIGVPVTDLTAGQDFFERLLGGSDILVKEDEVMWRVAEAAWLYVVVDPPRAGHALAASVGRGPRRNPGRARRAGDRSLAARAGRRRGAQGHRARSRREHRGHHRGRLVLLPHRDVAPALTRERRAVPVVPALA